MTLHTIWTITDPRHTSELRRANEDRSAAIVATFRPLLRASEVIRGLLGAASREIARRRCRMATLRQFARMSTRDLEDIGLTPGDVTHFAAGGELPAPQPAAPTGPAPVATTAPARPAAAFRIRDLARAFHPRGPATDTRSPSKDPTPARRAA